MFSYLWHTFFFDPIYNGLVFFIDVMPHGDVGLAIIALIVVVKVILLPLSIKAVKTQRLMKEIAPKLQEIKEKYKDQREEQAKAMMSAYREAGLNPFAGFLVMFIQIPVVIALYLAVYSGGGVALPQINADLLYSFLVVPSLVDMHFLGMIDIASKSLPLALLAGITQYFQIRYSMPELPATDPDKTPDFKDEFSRMLQLQMKYVFPPLIFVVAFVSASVIALYFVVTNVVTIILELFIRKHR